ncbi:hypothetical protein DICVIV_10241 [Dictyocaulus viviparus]|uniref:Uncharacterized protein n=1 Tax=Dictyocaulus viviparus TaxID=29172 RepID=A0A0D8XGN8_DICVI|nr:hypothetical protein DICVIV_10241 [Dictyocaulus viviparus]
MHQNVVNHWPIHQIGVNAVRQLQLQVCENERLQVFYSNILEACQRKLTEDSLQCERNITNKQVSIIHLRDMGRIHDAVEMLFDSKMYISKVGAFILNRLSALSPHFCAYLVMEAQCLVVILNMLEQKITGRGPATAEILIILQEVFLRIVECQHLVVVAEVDAQLGDCAKASLHIFHAFYTYPAIVDGFGRAILALYRRRGAKKYFEKAPFYLNYATRSCITRGMELGKIYFVLSVESLNELRHGVVLAAAWHIYNVNDFDIQLYPGDSLLLKVANAVESLNELRHGVVLAAAWHIYNVNDFDIQSYPGDSLLLKVANAACSPISIYYVYIQSVNNPHDAAVRIQKAYRSFRFIRAIRSCFSRHAVVDAPSSDLHNMLQTNTFVVVPEVMSFYEVSKTVQRRHSEDLKWEQHEMQNIGKVISIAILIEF